MNLRKLSNDDKSNCNDNNNKECPYLGRNSVFIDLAAIAIPYTVYYSMSNIFVFISPENMKIRKGEVHLDKIDTSPYRYADKNNLPSSRIIL